MSKTTEIARPPTLEETVRDRVRSAVFAAIPDTEIDRLIGAAWEAYFQPKKINVGSHYNPVWKAGPSAFEQLLTEIMEKEARAVLEPLVTERFQAFQPQSVFAAKADEIVERVAAGALERVVAQAVRCTLDQTWPRMQ